jgi:hypothetical protein
MSETNAPVRGKKSRRNPDKPSSKQNYYFTKETEQAIIDYQNTESISIKNKLYTEKIHPAFVEIANSLINVYKLAEGEDHQEVIHDCATALYELIGKFDATKGKPAFSYYSVIAKNWLIAKKKQRQKIKLSSVAYDSIDALSEDSDIKQSDFDALQESQTIPSPDSYISNDKFTEIVDNLWNELLTEIEYSDYCGSHEVLIIEACREIANNIESLELQTRQAMRLYIMEYTGLVKKDMIKALSNVRKIYKEVRGQVPGFLEYWEE